MFAPVLAPVFAPVLGFALANTPPPEFDPTTVTPTPLGFLAIFLVAVATILLGFDMVRRVRRTTYRAQIAEKLEAEVAARDAASPASPASPAAPEPPDTSRE
ncbi:MAG TPA: hypothetical protein VFC59_07970 [Cryobacterium sp.]|nr:hypothetical protein [Cryobacterium sp.]